jgi:hypothetical protein
MCKFSEDIDCNECIHFYKDKIFCRRLGCSLSSYNIDKGECSDFTRKDDDLAVGDEVLIRKPDNPTELSISWTDDMNWCDGYKAFVSLIESGTCILETESGTVLRRSYDEPLYVFHKNWLTKINKKEESIYRVISSNLGVPRYSKEFNLEELVEYLNKKSLCDVLIFEINNEGPDKILDISDWPVGFTFEGPYWKAK